jgi:hypothetical protein
MSRGGFKIDVGNHEIAPRQNSQCPNWLDRFAREYAKKEAAQTAVDVARERNNSKSSNVFEQMNAIISGNKAPYATVDEAVRDYQQRTGLVARAASSEVKAKAAQIIAAAEEEEVEKKNPEIPELISRIPDIEMYISNVIETNPHIQLPAILQMIHETFRRDGARESDISDPDFVRYVSVRLGERAKRVDRGPNTNLGRGVGIEREFSGMNDGNRNPWGLLEPMPYGSRF